MTEAWVTLATNDTYALGALVLAHSLKAVNTSKQLCVLVTPDVGLETRCKLEGVYNNVTTVNVLDSNDSANLTLLKRPELGVTLTKLHCWTLKQYTKCVFLDADILAIQNADELFSYPELTATSDIGWPDCFNSGMFVFSPSNETYSKLLTHAQEVGSFDGGDQGLLNTFFTNWNRVSFIYNMVSSVTYTYLPAYKQFGSDVKFVHFLGSTKPWHQRYNYSSGVVETGADQKHVTGHLSAWWRICSTYVQPELSQEHYQEPTMSSYNTHIDHSHDIDTHTQVIRHHQHDFYVQPTPSFHIPESHHIPSYSPDNSGYIESVQSVHEQFAHSQNEFHSWHSVTEQSNTSSSEHEQHHHSSNEQSSQPYSIPIDPPCLHEPIEQSYHHVENVQNNQYSESSQFNVDSSREPEPCHTHTSISHDQHYNEPSIVSEEKGIEPVLHEDTDIEPVIHEDTDIEPVIHEDTDIEPVIYEDTEVENYSEISSQVVLQNAPALLLKDSYEQNVGISTVHSSGRLKSSALPRVLFPPIANPRLPSPYSVKRPPSTGKLSDRMLGISLSNDQLAEERKRWETGIPDYLGKDSFDNIQAYIDSNLTTE